MGQLDDLAVLLVGMKLLRKQLPERILAECEASHVRPFCATHEVRINDPHGLSERNDKLTKL